VANFSYHLGPLVWKDDELGGSYCAPAGYVGLLDLGSIPAMSVQASDRPVALIWTPPGMVLGTGYAALGTGDCRELASSAAMMSAWESLSGWEPQGDTLVALLADHLIRGGDPDGLDGPRPLRPGRDGLLQIHMQGHSRVWAERFKWGVHPHTNKLKQMVKAYLKECRKAAKRGEYINPLLGHQVDTDFHLAIAQAHMEKAKKWGVTDFEEFRPDDWSKAEKPKKHGTTLTDTFNRSDSNSLGTASGGFSWASVSGDWDISSNTAIVGTANSGSSARADSDFASDGHYCQFDLTTLTAGNLLIVATCVRFSSSADTHYNYRAMRNDEAYTDLLRKTIAGTPTTVAGASALTLGTLPKVMYVEFTEADAYTCKYDGSSRFTGTDTSITGNTRAGLLGYDFVLEGIAVDNFEAGDWASGSARPKINNSLAHGRGRLVA